MWNAFNQMNRVNYSLRLLAFASLFYFSLSSISGCELCAIYSATSAQSGSEPGFRFTIAEQYISAGTLQAEGEEFSSVPFLSRAYLNSSYTHLVPEYSFSRFGIALNAPIIYRDFRRTEILTTGGTVDETGTLAGFGDMALIARATVFQKNRMKYSIKIDLLAGVKFPTGDTEQLDAEVAEAKLDEELYGKDHPHSGIGGIHQHDLSLGSGSYDGVFGISSNFRWKRLFLNNQTQYYLRTEGHSYEYGDLIIVSGGPGGYVLLEESFSLSIQANAFYESSARDEIIGQVSNQTGMTAWYMGPLISFSWGEHFSAGIGAEFPLRIYNHGVQTVPDYRVHGAFSWRF